jgi:DHA1 family tetracycline resistance protein-like MFS transporter
MSLRHQKRELASDVAKRERSPMPAGFWTIWTTVALDLVGFGIVVPILGRYAERFGASGFEVGLLFATFSLAQMVFAPLLGRLSDRIGRKPVIVLSLVGTAIGSVVTGAAGALWVLFLGRALDGASGASVAVAQGAVIDIAPPEQRARLIGLLGAAFGVGFVLGPALGGLAALGGPHVPFYVAGAIAGINAIAAYIRLPETKPQTSVSQEKSNNRGSSLTPALRRMAIVLFIGTVSFAGFEATFSLFGQKRFSLTEGSNAMLFLFVGLVMVVVQGMLIGPLTEKLGSRSLMRIGLAAISLGFVGMAYTYSWAPLFVVLFLVAVGQGVFGPSSGALVAELAPEEKRGEALGYQQSAGALGRVAGPVLGGVLFDAAGTGAPYLFGAALMLIALAAVWSLTRSTSTALN